MCLFSDLFWLTLSVSFFNPLAQLFYFSILFGILSWILWCVPHTLVVFCEAILHFLSSSAEPLPHRCLSMSTILFLFLISVFSLSFPSSLWDGLSDLSSTFLSDFSVVSVVCFALSKTVHLFHFYSLQFFSHLSLHVIPSVYILGSI